MTLLKLTKVGKSTAVVLPEEMLIRLKVGSGGLICAVETENGVFI